MDIPETCLRVCFLSWCFFDSTDSPNNWGWKWLKEVYSPTSCSKQAQLWDQTRLLRLLLYPVLYLTDFSSPSFNIAFHQSKRHFSKLVDEQENKDSVYEAVQHGIYKHAAYSVSIYLLNLDHSFKAQCILVWCQAIYTLTDLTRMPWILQIQVQKQIYQIIHILEIRVAVNWTLQLFPFWAGSTIFCQPVSDSKPQSQCHLTDKFPCRIQVHRRSCCLPEASEVPGGHNVHRRGRGTEGEWDLFCHFHTLIR